MAILLVAVLPRRTGAAFGHRQGVQRHEPRRVDDPGRRAVARGERRDRRVGGQRPGLARARQELPGLHPQVRVSVPGLRCRRPAAQCVPAPSKPGTRAPSTPAFPVRTRSRLPGDAGSQGKELERTQLFKWTARQNPPGMQMSITPGTGGWNQVRIQLRGDVTAPRAGGRGDRPGTAPRQRRRRASPPTVRWRCASAAAKCASRM